MTHLCGRGWVKEEDGEEESPEASVGGGGVGAGAGGGAEGEGAGGGERGRGGRRESGSQRYSGKYCKYSLEILQIFQGNIANIPYSCKPFLLVKYILFIGIRMMLLTTSQIFLPSQSTCRHCYSRVRYRRGEKGSSG